MTLLAPKGWGWGEHIEIEESVWRHYEVEPSFSIHWLPAPGPRPSYPYGVVAAAYICLRSPRALVYARHLPGAVASALFRRRLVFEAHELPSSSGALGALRAGAPPGTRAGGRDLPCPSRRHPRALAGVGAGRRHRRSGCRSLRRERWDPFSRGGANASRHRVRGRADGGLRRATLPWARSRHDLKMAERLPDVSYLLVGGEPQDVSLFENTAREHELGNVTLTGFVAPADVPLHLDACDALLMPYQRRVSVAGSGGIRCNG